MFRVISPLLAAAETRPVLSGPVSRGREIIVLTLAILALLVGVMPRKPLELLQIGRPQITSATLAMTFCRIHIVVAI